MIDHLTLHVNNFEKSKAFYLAALAPLDYTAVMAFPGAAGLGAGHPDFWIVGDGAGKSTHIAFATKSRTVVDRFHAAALAAGARDNGAPGLRAHYHPNYYGAFVFDPDGNNVEVVCHLPA
jgi:catechol 2,3-dioxygenase-like lactoylglutathione lyase family enzyme